MSIGLFKNRYEATPSLLVYSKYRAVDDLSLQPCIQVFLGFCIRSSFAT